MNLVLDRRRIVLVAIILAVLATLVYVLAVRPSTVQHTAYFTRATGLYEGNEIKILGVTVGEVVKITREGAQVKVDFTLDADQEVPADVKAAIVAPSLVTGRFVQLAPAYAGKGATLAEGASIPVERTAVPVEFDTVKEQLTELTTALGPNKDNPRGALHDLIDTASANLDNGTAEALNQSITNMSKAATTLNAGSDDMFATVANLQSFLNNLVKNQVAIEAFSKRLGSVSGQLADDSQMLSTTLSTLKEALALVTKFLNDNRAVVGKSVSELGELTGTLSKQRDEVANVLHNVPNLAANATNIIDPTYAAIMGRITVNNLNGIGGLVCGAMLGVGGTAEDCRKVLVPLMESLGLPQTVPGTPGIPLDTPLSDQAGPLPTVDPPGGPLQDPATAAGDTVDTLTGLLAPTGEGR